MGARRRWSARGRPGHLAQSGGRARPVVAVSNKGGGRRKGGSAGPVLAVMPALMRHSEVRGEVRIRGRNPVGRWGGWRWTGQQQAAAAAAADGKGSSLRWEQPFFLVLVLGKNPKFASWIHHPFFDPLCPYRTGIYKRALSSWRWWLTCHVIQRPSNPMVRISFRFCKLFVKGI